MSMAELLHVESSTSSHHERQDDQQGFDIKELVSDRESDHPHKLADVVYDAICKDGEEQPSRKGLQSFRDKVFETCNAKQIILKGVRIGGKASAALCKQVLSSPSFSSSLRTLDLSANQLAYYGVLSVLQIIRSVPSLKFVSLGNNSIGSNGAHEIAKMLSTNTSLWSLDLGSASSAGGAGGGRGGSSSSSVSSVSSVSGAAAIGGVGRNRVDGKSAAKLALALCRNRSLTSLSLNANDLGADGLKAAETFAVMLTRNKSLTQLSLQDNQLGSKGAALVLASLAKNQTLRHLNLSGNGVGSDAGRTISAVLQTNDTLASLRLNGNSLGVGMLSFCEALTFNTSLIILELEGNGIGDSGAEAIAQVLLTNRTLTAVNVADNQITPRGAHAMAVALAGSPVLASLNIAHNSIKNESCVALADGLVGNRVISELDISSCKIGDTGVAALVSAIGNNPHCVIRKLRVRDNYITADAGDAIVDGLFRNTSLTVADFRGNQIDHVRLGKIKSICSRNLTQIKDLEPRRLRAEIGRLRGEQIKLRQAQHTLAHHRAAIQQTRQRINVIEEEKAKFLSLQQQRREEIRAQIEREKQSIEEARGRLEEKKRELSGVEAAYSERLAETQIQLDAQLESRRQVEAQLAKVKKELADTVRDRPAKVNELKMSIEEVKQEKAAFQNQLTHIRKELLRLQQAYQDAQPIPHLIEQAKALLMANAESMDQITLEQRGGKKISKKIS